jgi:hypothetical protein
MHFPKILRIQVLLTIVASCAGTLLGLTHSISDSTGGCISYSSSSVTITISCTSATRLTDVNNAIHNSAILKKESNWVWTLAANIVIAKYGNFIIDDFDTSWLKISSSATKSYGIKNYGNLKIDSVKNNIMECRY